MLRMVLDCSDLNVTTIINNNNNNDDNDYNNNYMCPVRAPERERERERERENYICSSHLGLIRWSVHLDHRHIDR